MPTVKIDTQSTDSFRSAMQTLIEYAAQNRSLRTPNFSVAIAALLFRSSGIAPRASLVPLIHSPGQGTPISTGDLQTSICDMVFQKEKHFLPSKPQGPIYKPFTDSFKPSSSSSANNWRNSFDLQAGLSCDAPYTKSYLMSPIFLAEKRFDCDFRDAKTGQCLSTSGHTGKSRTCFNPNKRAHPPGPASVAAMTPKLLARGKDLSGTEGYWIIEPTTEVLLDLIGNPFKRVPLYPFIGALYGGSTLLTHHGKTIDRSHFQADLRLEDERFLSIFDPDPASSFNSAFLSFSTSKRNRKISETSLSVSSVDTFENSTENRELTQKTAYKVGRNLAKFKDKAGNLTDPASRLLLLEKASRAHVRTLDLLAKLFLGAGICPTEQIGGFDLLVEVADQAHLFEIKTWRPENLRAQIRAAIAQLYEYRWRNRDELPKSKRPGNTVFPNWGSLGTMRD